VIATGFVLGLPVDVGWWLLAKSLLVAALLAGGLAWVVLHRHP
jgi:hypothetical protein